MTNSNNPWCNMAESSQRRVNSQIKHNLYWITDLKGNYGFGLVINKELKKTDDSLKLKGITIIKRNSRLGHGELFLVLNKKEDWQIFYTLCKDLIAIACSFDTEEKMMYAIEIRLNRWQQLLKQDRNQKLSLEIQMGLFSELMCLRDVIAPKLGIKQAVVSWVGPEFDKQDFLIDNAVIEVKSYRTSKGEVIHISSLEQLQSPKEPLFLLSNGLTCSEKGISIKEITESIKGMLQQESSEIMNIFENKLMAYGYIEEFHKDHLHKFTIDSKKGFHISDTFPKIRRGDINNSIIQVKYAIDLTQCSEFEVEIDSIFRNEVFV